MPVERYALLLLVCLSFASPAYAADWPRKPIRLIHGFTPGGNVDITARITAQVLSEAARLGWPAECVHTERFSPADDVARGRPFTLRIASSGRLVEVPADRSALAALADAGIIIPSSCGQG